MKMLKEYPFILPALIMVVLVSGNPNAWADPSSGEPAVVSVATSVHAAAAVASLADEFDGVMDEYEKEVSEARKKELLERARNILTKLIEQANNVESEISILSKKKLNEVYSRKLDRVLSSVLQMREAAQKRMQAAAKPG